MVRKMILIVIVLVAIAGCNEEQLTTWLGTAQKTDLSLQVGVLDDAGTSEVGVQIEYDRSTSIEPSYRPDRIGPYFTFWLTQDVTIEDTPEPSPIKDLLESLHARPYLTGSLLGVPDDGWRDIQPNYQVGTFFTMEEDGNIGWYVGYQDGDTVVPGTFIGGIGRF